MHIYIYIWIYISIYVCINDALSLFCRWWIPLVFRVAAPASVPPRAALYARREKWPSYELKVRGYRLFDFY